MVLLQCQNPACRDFRVADDMILVTRDEVAALLCVDCVIGLCDPAEAASEALAATGS